MGRGPTTTTSLFFHDIKSAVFPANVRWLRYEEPADMTSNTSTDTLLGITDCARELGISETYTRTLANSGRLPCLRTKGGQRVFKLADVRAFQRQRARRTSNKNQPAAVT
jgi:excisionase family DNA binding protein